MVNITRRERIVSGVTADRRLGRGENPRRRRGWVKGIESALTGRSEALAAPAIEFYARGLSTRDIEDGFADETGRRLPSGEYQICRHA